MHRPGSDSWPRFCIRYVTVSRAASGEQRSRSGGRIASDPAILYTHDDIVRAASQIAAACCYREYRFSLPLPFRISCRNVERSLEILKVRHRIVRSCREPAEPTSSILDQRGNEVKKEGRREGESGSKRESRLMAIV